MADEFSRPRLTVTFDKDEYENIKKQAKKNGLTVSGYIRYILKKEMRSEGRHSSW